MRLGGSYGDRDRGMLDLKSVDMRFMYLTELSGKNICRQAVEGYA